MEKLTDSLDEVPVQFEPLPPVPSSVLKWNRADLQRRLLEGNAISRVIGAAGPLKSGRAQHLESRLDPENVPHYHYEVPSCSLSNHFHLFLNLYFSGNGQV